MTTKIADFGLSKKASFIQRRKSTTIVSLYYRAPEIIFGSEQYFCGVDIWSVGCIFYEMMSNGHVLFGDKTEEGVLNKIFYLLGTPTKSHHNMYLMLPRWSLINFKYYDPPLMANQSWNSRFDPLFNDLLNKMLVLDPEHRITAKEALKHGFFKPQS